ncbi:hypothetical protein [Streptomyces sp. ODS28]|uniref:esterase/lipase family protein n=1 Tax=Streptomyces sp. ODS28 TaxID=3136688 RepID=UPI0031E7F1D8
MALPMKDVVVLLPGITGSRLTREGRDVWALSPGALMRGLVSGGGTVRQLALGEDDPGAEHLSDGVRAPSLMPDLSILPGLRWRIDGYGAVDVALRRRFHLTPGENYFPFPYDWRRDNRAHAHRLARESAGWLAAWRAESGNADARLVLIAHSMGGLVARYFLECLEGWRDTRTLITFGTPYSGSLNALGFLANGLRKKLGPLTLADLGATVATFTSVYQLLPVFQSVDLGDGVLRRLGDLAAPGGAGGGAPLQEPYGERASALLERLDPWRLEAALRFHREIDEAVTRHRAEDYEGTGGYDIRPVIGEFQPTAQSAVVEGAGVRLLEERNGADEGGDGTVPRLSSVPRELFGTMANVAFAAHRHSALQNSDPVLTHVHGLLRGTPADPGMFFAGMTRVALDVDELFAAGEPVRVRARCDSPGTRLSAHLEDAASRVVVERRTLGQVGQEWREFEMEAPPPGDYRLVLSGRADVDRVSEVFTVVDTDS